MSSKVYADLAITELICSRPKEQATKRRLKKKRAASGGKRKQPK